MGRVKQTDARATVHRHCLRAFRSRSVISSKTLKLRLPREIGKAAQKHLRNLCAKKQLTRAGRDCYVPQPSPRTTEAIPSQIFPYQGSKRKLTSLLTSVLQNELAIGKRRGIVSPFVGTGVVEGTLRNLGVKVRAHDLNCNIVNVHRALKSPQKRIAVVHRYRAELRALKCCPSDAKKKERFRRVLRDGVLKSRRTSGCALAAARWILGQKVAYLGMLTRSCALSLDRLAPMKADVGARQIAAHRGLGNLCSRQNAFKAVQTAKASDLLFVDPPYLSDKKRSQYEAGDFGLAEHKELAAALRGKHFVLCHRECPVIRKLYKKCHIIAAPAIMQLNRKGASRKEMLVVGRP